MIANNISKPTAQLAAGTNTFSVTSSTGNMQVLVLVCGSSVAISSITDNKGNNYTLVATSEDNPNGIASIFYAVGVSTGITSIIVSSTGSGGITIGAYDVSTVTGGFPEVTAFLDAQTTANPSLTVAGSSVGITIACFLSVNTVSGISSPFVQESLDDTHTYTATSAYNTSGSYTCTLTASAGGWCGVLVNFKETDTAHTQIGYFLVGF